MAPASRSLARASATVTALATAIGVGLLPWGVLGWTRALAVGALGLSALLLHLRGVGAQITSRALWLWTVWLSVMHLGTGAGPSFAWLTLAGALTTLALRGGDGLSATSTGAFQPRRYRAPLLLSLALALTTALGFTTYGVALREGWGFSSGNLNIAASLAVACFGLVRMRTWGLLLLGAIDAWIIMAASRGELTIPTLSGAAIFGLLSAGSLIGLSPWLYAAGARLLRDAEPRDRVRVAVPADRENTSATVSGIDSDVDAELEASTAARPVTLRSSR